MAVDEHGIRVHVLRRILRRHERQVHLPVAIGDMPGTQHIEAVGERFPVRGDIGGRDVDGRFAQLHHPPVNEDGVLRGVALVHALDKLQAHLMRVARAAALAVLPALRSGPAELVLVRQYAAVPGEQAERPRRAEPVHPAAHFEAAAGAHGGHDAVVMERLLVIRPGQHIRQRFPWRIIQQRIDGQRFPVKEFVEARDDAPLVVLGATQETTAAVLEFRDATHTVSGQHKALAQQRRDDGDSMR